MPINLATSLNEWIGRAAADDGSLGTKLPPN
jgi:hypothetical protein